MTISPQLLSNREIAEILNKADVIETWIKAVREYAQTMIECGDEVPGWVLKPKRGIRKWKDVRIVKQRLASEGLEGFLVEELASPAQVEKMAKKQGLQLDFFDLIETTSSGLVLVREDDKQAASAQSAAADFSN